MRRIVGVVAVGASLAVVPALASASASSGHVCQGTFKKPGVLKGRYASDVIVKGVCAVNSGKAHVIGTVTVTKGATLAAAFGLHHSALTITGNLVLDKGAVALLGCKVNPDGSGFPCIDDHQKQPTLTSHEVITGSVTENAPLGVIVHNSTIGGNLTESGGGGGLSCAPPKTGVFAKFHSPVYSDYEDTSIGGNAVIKDLQSCWLGFNRVYVHGTATISKNEMADPDAIEVLSNYIAKNLSCHGNSHPAGMPPGDKAVWDSTEASFGAIYPRKPQPNTVEGTRSGQCVHATPTTQGGPSAGLF